MRKSKTIKIDDKEITVKELTAGQITNEIENLGKGGLDDIDMLFPDKLPSSVLKTSTEFSNDDLSKFAPSELEVLLDAVEEVNPTFARLIKSLADMGRKAMADGKLNGHVVA
jgi:hypothetical protein